MKKLFSIAAVMATAAFAFNAQAAAIVFNGADSTGSGDLANPDHWAGGNLPPSSSAVTFNKSGVLTASDSVSFAAGSYKDATGRLTFNTLNPVTFTEFSAPTYGTELYVTGKSVINNNGNVSIGTVSNGGNVRMVLDGANVSYALSLKNAVMKLQGTGTELVITNGAHLRTAGTLNIGATGGDSNRVTVCEGGLVDTDLLGGLWKNTVVGGGTSCGNRLDVYGKYVHGDNYQDLYVGESDGSSNNVVQVHAGATFETQGRWEVGLKGQYNLFYAKDAEKVTLTGAASDRGLVVGAGANAHHNKVILDTVGTLTLAKGIYIGYYPKVDANYPGGASNRFDLIDCPWPGVSFYLGKSATSVGNELNIRYTKAMTGFKMSSVNFGEGAGNVVRVRGTTITSANNEPKLPSVTATPGCQVVFGEGTTLLTGGAAYVDLVGEAALVFDNCVWSHKAEHTGGNNARLTFRAGGHLVARNNAIVSNCYETVNFGLDGESVSGCRLEVLSGAVYEAGDFRWHGSDNLLTISNATFHCVTDNYGYPRNKSVVSTNAVIRFEGDCPRFDGTVAFKFNYVADLISDPRLEYALPTEPYAVAPLTAPSITLPKTTKIRLALGEKSSKYAGEYVLAEATGKTGVITVADMAELGSELPENCKLVLSKDKKRLSAKFKTGLVLFVR